MSKKARPGQGARRRAKKRAEAAKANPDAIDSAKASTLTRRQRITVSYPQTVILIPISYDAKANS